MSKRLTPYDKYVREVVKAFSTVDLALFKKKLWYKLSGDKALLCSAFIACIVPAELPLLQNITLAYGSADFLLRQLEAARYQADITGKEDYNRKKDLITVFWSQDAERTVRANSRMLKIFEPLDPLYGITHKSAIITAWCSDPGKDLYYGGLALIDKK